MILPVLKAMRPSDVTEAELKHPHPPLEFLEVVRVFLDYCFPSWWKNTWECDVMPHQLCLGRMLIGRQGVENSASSHSAKNSLTSALHGQKKESEYTLCCSTSDYSKRELVLPWSKFYTSGLMIGPVWGEQPEQKALSLSLQHLHSGRIRELGSFMLTIRSLWPRTVGVHRLWFQRQVILRT